jgi:hypothetical protein
MEAKAKLHSLHPASPAACPPKFTLISDRDTCQKSAPHNFCNGIRSPVLISGMNYERNPKHLKGKCVSIGVEGDVDSSDDSAPNNYMGSHENCVAWVRILIG